MLPRKAGIGKRCHSLMNVDIRQIPVYNSTKILCKIIIIKSIVNNRKMCLEVISANFQLSECQFYSSVVCIRVYVNSGVSEGRERIIRAIVSR